MQRNHLLFVLLVFLFSCSIQKDYKNAKTKNDVNSCTYFLRKHPNSKYASEIKSRLNRLHDNIAWNYASRLNTETSYEQYLLQNPDGIYTYDANLRRQALIAKRMENARRQEDENAWGTAKYYNTVYSYKKYLNDFKNGKYVTEANARIRDLEYTSTQPSVNSNNNSYSSNINSNDRKAWEIAKKTNTIASYKGYIKKYPNGLFVDEAEGKIIDIEVSSIMAGKHGEMPAPQRVYSGSLYRTTVDIAITNSTNYTLTVLYSGPTSKKLVISPGYSNSITLSPGLYKVAAKVSASNVRPFAGTNHLDGGSYTSNFYISTTRSYGGIYSNF